MSTISSAVSTTLSSAAATSTAENRAPPQGGVLEGANPSHYDPSNPIILFIIQVPMTSLSFRLRPSDSEQTSLIVIVCHALHWPLSKIRQPRVIAEVIGGIILGPSVMGRVPGFRASIFPKESIPNLNLVANLGLVLYLFLIGLETDVRFLLSNWRVATSVAFAGLALPFAVGCGLAWGVYNAFKDDSGVHPTTFTTYMLFIGIAIAITVRLVPEGMTGRSLFTLQAFPVLCRILTELKLLDTSVGVITLSAGVANDVVGWILLALCVALVNAGSGLTALWILLCCVAYMLLLMFAVKPALIWLLRRTGSIENDPSQSVISLILLIALASAFFTGIIGVHPIFGGFMAGLILPRENRFNIRVTEKLEDLIGAIFLPLYFTLSGLNTNLGLLDTGTAWGYVFATTTLALFTKIIGASIAARVSGLVWRESFTIGVLMSCKGLVELIVLNIGLQANILSTRTFTIFVVMALLTTFATTPIVSVLYPPWYQVKIEAWRRGEIDWDTGATVQLSDTDDSAKGKPPAETRVTRMLAHLRLDSMPALLSLMPLFGEPAAAPTLSVDSKDSKTVTERAAGRPVWVHGTRLLQLGDRDSSVMTVAQVSDFSRHDPVVNTFRTVGQLHNLSVSGDVAVMPESRFAEALVSKAAAMSSDLLILPWSETGGMGDAPVVSTTTLDDKMASTYASFVKSVLESCRCNVGIFFSRPDFVTEAAAKEPDHGKLSRRCSTGALPIEVPAPLTPVQPHHIFLPYFGGEDDQVALRLVLQLCQGSQATACIMRVSMSEQSSSGAADAFDSAQSRLPADEAVRVKFSTVRGPATAEELVQLADSEAEVKTSSLVVCGHGSGVGMDPGKLANAKQENLVACLGLIAGHFVAAGVRSDMLVVRAPRPAEVT
ncbi:hypothetical protein L249_0466 [Ophiocordyceps polyrhachis-furcata BCC 54312]|uniref:Cation/H+ exchanger transmembrane domain-containing protein n=1 Tax=Ophiocordyceps polyrhachis-furcata BCC 54312 TaxID=1330021 RepID=A0A367LF12_9HYPO|nr:hypothetical protein L249_0466 [Ophiocordyceps polyrhachis-furcata BCC 54312]